MRIGLLLDDTLDTPDGVQQYILSLGGWLSSQGHEVHYLVGQTSRTDIPNVHSMSKNIRVTFNGNVMSMPLPASRKKLLQLLKATKFDVIHIQTPYSPFFAGRLIKLVSPQTAVIGTFHVLPYDAFSRLANKVLATLNHRTARRFDAMIAATDPAADFARQYYHFRTQVIPHPFDRSKFISNDTYGVQNHIVYLGRLVERKGASYLLQAVASLKHRQMIPYGTTVSIGGKGPLLSKLQAYVKANDLENIVSFDGFVTEDRKAAYLAAADIMVLPSVSGESFGISVIEALAAAHGVVLAGDNPGYRSVMPDANMLVHPKDSVAFADILAYWLQRPSERTRAAAMQQAYTAQFDLPIIGNQVEIVYAQVLQTKHNA